MEKIEAFRLESGRYGRFLTRFGSATRSATRDAIAGIARRLALLKLVFDMPAIYVTRRDGSAQSIEAPAGQSLMRTLKDCGVHEIQALCGGCASCGTCHIYVAEAWLDRLPPMRADEDELLGFSDRRRANSRLACQIPFIEALDGIALAVAPED